MQLIMTHICVPISASSGFSDYYHSKGGSEESSIKSAKYVKGGGHRTLIQESPFMSSVTPEVNSEFF